MEQALKIRALKSVDSNKIKEIHEKFYQREFSFPDFITNFMCAYVIEDEKGIISVAGLRSIAEVVAITNKDRSVRDRIEALAHVLNVSKYFALENNYDSLHAFVQDSAWQKHLERIGFRPTKGNALVLFVGQGEGDNGER